MSRAAKRKWAKCWPTLGTWKKASFGSNVPPRPATSTHSGQQAPISRMRNVWMTPWHGSTAPPRPTTPEHFDQLVKPSLLAGRLDDALVWFDRAAARGDALSTVMAADWLQAAGRTTQALASLESSDSGQDHYAARAIARQLADAGRIDEALPWFDRAAALGDATALRTAALRLVSAGRSDEAVAWLERAADSGDADALGELIELLLRDNRMDEAWPWADRAVSAGRARVLNDIAHQLVVLGREEEALAWFKRAIAGGDVHGFRQTAERLSGHNRLNESLLWYERAACHGDVEALTRAARHSTLRADQVRRSTGYSVVLLLDTTTAVPQWRHSSGWGRHTGQISYDSLDEASTVNLPRPGDSTAVRMPCPDSIDSPHRKQQPFRIQPSYPDPYGAAEHAVVWARPIGEVRGSKPPRGTSEPKFRICGRRGSPYRGRDGVGGQ